MGERPKDVEAGRNQPEAESIRAHLERVERLQAMAMLAGGVAHDISSLAGAVRLTAQSAMKHADDDAMRGHLEAIEHCATMAGELVGMLLSHARPDVDGPEPVELTVLVEQNQRMIQMLAGRRLQVVTELERVPPVVGRRLELLQAICNLVMNAAESVGVGGGTVWLRTCFDGRTVCVEVQDDGPGFASSALEHAKEPFFTTKPDGYGLGLSLVARVVGTHGGRLTIESPPGRGATVRLCFPVD